MFTIRGVHHTHFNLHVGYVDVDMLTFSLMNNVEVNVSLKHDGGEFLSESPGNVFFWFFMGF